MGQGGERYIVMNDPENVDKWGQKVKVDKEEEPPYEDFETLKLLNAIKSFHILVDDPNILLYVQETDEYQSCYFTKKLDSSPIEMEKVLYIYLDGMNTTRLTPITIDKFGITYETMEQRVVEGIIWHGLLIPELAPRAASSMSMGG